jgi:hypothetical protein
LQARIFLNASSFFRLRDYVPHLWKQAIQLYFILSARKVDEITEVSPYNNNNNNKSKTKQQQKYMLFSVYPLDLKSKLFSGSKVF